MRSPKSSSVQPSITFQGRGQSRTTEQEQQEYSEFAWKQIDDLGQRDGLLIGLQPIFLHPEALYRIERGEGAGKTRRSTQDWSTRFA